MNFLRVKGLVKIQLWQKEETDMPDSEKYFVMGSYPNVFYLKVIVLEIPFGFCCFVRINCNLNLVDS